MLCINGDTEAHRAGQIVPRRHTFQFGLDQTHFFRAAALQPLLDRQQLQLLLFRSAPDFRDQIAFDLDNPK